MKNFILISLMVFSTSALSATLESLTQAQMNQIFVNKTTVSVQNDIFEGQIVPKTFSFYLDGQGSIKGKFGMKPKHEPQVDKGIYNIGEDGTLYVTWKHWYNGKKICFHLFDTKNAYISVDCDNLFHTVYLKESITAGDSVS